MAFKVDKIIDGETIQVLPKWKWDGRNGFLVRILGYKKPESDYEPYTVEKLKKLLSDNEVDLRGPREVREEGDRNMIVCHVYLNNIDISTYFPELKTK